MTESERAAWESEWHSLGCDEPPPNEREIFLRGYRAGLAAREPTARYLRRHHATDCMRLGG